MKYYTGIGSRGTPQATADIMTALATKLEADGYTLRSGAAEGADAAFEKGQSSGEIYLPWPGFNGSKSPLSDGSPVASYIASTLHPAWEHLSQGAKKLMARNVFQVCGNDFQTMSDFVVCWTPDGCTTHESRTSKTGGTGLAISLAHKMGIEVVNLQTPEGLQKVQDYLKDA